MRKLLLAGALLSMGAGPLATQQTFQHTITGETLDILGVSPVEDRDTEAVKRFLQTGINPYTEVASCLPKGEETYLTACSGCHGHVAEGKLGPGLNDSYWTYPKNSTDKGLFETIFGGAQGMMGPHGGHLTLDETLRLMAWIRHLYKGDVAEAAWLGDEQKKTFTPFKEVKGGDGSAAASEKPAGADGCKISAQ